MDKAIEEIILEVSKKKELKEISHPLIKEILEKIIRKKKWDLTNLREKDKKLLIKEIRHELRDYVGRFQTKVNKRNALLKEKDWLGLLMTHTSTKERIPIYPKVVELVYSLNPTSILDIGCGLNPLGIAKPGIKYYASDINNSDLEIVSSFFKDNNISGKTFLLDITSDNLELPKADVILAFKLLDFLEKKSKNLSIRFLKQVNSKYLIVSFANNKISGKKMNSPKRNWFETICNKMNFNFEFYDFDSESFYVLRKE